LGKYPRGKEFLMTPSRGRGNMWSRKGNRHLSQRKENRLLEIRGAAGQQTERPRDLGVGESRFFKVIWKNGSLGRKKKSGNKVGEKKLTVETWYTRKKLTTSLGILRKRGGRNSQNIKQQHLGGDIYISKRTRS